MVANIRAAHGPVGPSGQILEHGLYIAGLRVLDPLAQTQVHEGRHSELSAAPVIGVVLGALAQGEEV